MSFEFFLRLLGMIILAAVGWGLGLNLAGPTVNESEVMRGVLSLALAGGALGLLLTPYVTIRPLAWLGRRLGQIPANQLVGIAIGLMFGLGAAALLTPPLAQLPGVLGQVLPFVAALLLAYTGVQTMVLRERDLVNMFQARFGPPPDRRKQFVLLDTSVIIDGRIADIAQTGFIDATMLVPRFVLTELQHIAGAKDPLRRNRGKRGLEVLNQLQKGTTTRLEIRDVDIPDIEEVDAKLVALARDLQANVLTTDYNLNQVAELQGVQVLNINELANAVKTVMLPGEEFRIKIIQSGREHNQGVGYLSDGTMVVVEHGQQAIGQEREVEVTRVLQTVAGRMIFAQMTGLPNGQNDEAL